ncbi:MAG TPA: class III lanthipeptide [Candidatus Angelobacter sp.]|nr:class III lanthipeptide [Candidatus Angelobacter sp.]
MPEYKMTEPESMETVLNLQALELSEEETDFFGNSCTSSSTNCCNDSHQVTVG